MRKTRGRVLSFLAALGLAVLPAGAQSHENNTGAPEAPLPASAGPVWAGPEGTVLYNNGALVTHPGAGFGGADESRLQSVSLVMNTLGFGHQVVNANRVADDFTVTGNGWNISALTFFAYQTGSTTTSTFTAVNFRIWDGPPNAGGVVIVDQSALATLSSSAFANIYRVSETTIGGNTRPIFANTQNVNITLNPGTYWLDWQTNGTLASGPWAPPVTILGTAVTGNGLQSLAGVWGLALDTGTAMAQQAFPFIIEGEPITMSDLSVTKTCSEAPVGGTSTCTITVSNAGPDAANNVVATDAIPAGLTYLANDCGATFASPNLTWNIGTLAASASVVCNVDVTATDAGPFVNVVTVTADETDPVTSNNSSTATLGFVPGPPGIPTLGTWGLAALVVLLIGTAVFVLRRRA